MDNDRADGPQRARLPGFEDPAEPRQPAYNWYPSHGGPPPGYPWPAPSYARDDGIRSSRRASSWTAAALIAGVAATTGYLAHAIPGTATSGTTKSKTTAHKSTSVTPSTPYVAPPVTTSGGSGGGGGGGGDR